MRFAACVDLGDFGTADPEQAERDARDHLDRIVSAHKATHGIQLHGVTMRREISLATGATTMVAEGYAVPLLLGAVLNHKGDKDYQQARDRIEAALHSNEALGALGAEDAMAILRELVDQARGAR